MNAVLATPYVEPKPATPQWTVGSWLSYWLDSIYRPTVDIKTYEGAEITVRLHLLPDLASIPLADFSAMDVQRLIATRISEHYAPRTIRFILSKLNIALNTAVDYGLLDKNPASRVKKPRVEDAERVILSEAQARTLLQVAQERGWGLIVIVGVYTGMRAGEIYGLHWDDIDWQAGTIRIDSATVQTKAAGVIEKAPKTKQSRRTIPVPPLVLSLLAAHRETQAAIRQEKGAAWNKRDYIFPNRKGEPRASHTTWRPWHELLQAAGLPDMPFHGLRHNFASFLAHLLIPERAVQELLGHMPGSTITREVYIHSLEGAGQKAMAQLAELLKVQENG